MKNIILLIILAILFLTGCNNEPQIDNKKNDEKSKETETTTQEEKEDESKTEYFEYDSNLPKTVNDLVNQPAGEFADESVLSDELEPIIRGKMKDIPVLREDATEEEYEKYLSYAYDLVSTDFPDPQDLISKWEFSMFGNPDLPNQKLQFKENYNVEIILDASGSMANKIGGKTRMEQAKEAIRNFLSNAPKEANVSLRVYGHVGTSNDIDKAKSCSAIEQVYGFEKYDDPKFSKALDQFKPSGWTPVASSLEASKKAFEQYDGSNNTNLIYLVSDGIETCDGNPVAVAKSFSESNISPIINVIGFDADVKAQQQLKEVAKSAKGIYTTVTSGEQLKEEFERARDVLEAWEDWKKDSLRNVQASKVDNSFDILAFTNDWSFKAQRQENNVSYTIGYLRKEGKITFQQEEKLNKNARDVSKMVNQAKKEIEQNLKNLNIKNTEELKNKINEEFQSNTNN